MFNDVGTLLQTFNEGRVINVFLKESKSWEDVMHIIHDVGQFFDPINAATALHRLAKHNERQRVRTFLKDAYDTNIMSGISYPDESGTFSKFNHAL